MHFTRRDILSQGLTSLAILSPLGHWLSKAAGADAATIRRASSLRITEIERHEILLPYHDFNATTLFRYHGLGIQLRTIFIAKTNVDGLIGYGDAWGRGPDQKDVDKYVGTNPFDWIGDTTTLATNMAMYDVMGKFLNVPSWKLIGPKVRNRVPVAAWTVSQPPKQMADEVKHAASQGYRWLKYHIDELQNIFDQTEAMQAVAPDGFKIHYDFNGNSNFKAIMPVVKRLENYRIAGRIEDPISANDSEGWRRIRQATSLPVLGHHAPVEFLLNGACDGLMTGHAAVGSAAKVAAVAEQVNKPIMLQNAGGTLNQAFQVHQAAIFKMATIDHVNLARLWKDDVTKQTMPIRDGFVEVPKGPGLGISIDGDKLKTYASVSRPKHRKFLVRIRYKNGPTIYTRHDPHLPGATDNMRYLGRLLGKNIPGPIPAYDNDVFTDFWDDVDSPEFQRLWKMTANRFVTEN